ncbi:MAG: DUF3866 family protein [Acidimicrobiales bacterium]
MPSFRTTTVTAMLSERDGLQRVDTAAGRAFVLTGLTGPVAVGDDVVVNTTAVELGLGTGGWHVVHWNLARKAWTQSSGGHIMKLRYTSLQADAGAAEEDIDDLPHELGGIPVVACTVHSQVACVAAAAKETRPAVRVVYVMTDGGALPLALSDLVEALRERDVLEGTITAGHAFGGDHEAVSVPSALLLARHVMGADIVVVGMGPGVVGSGTALGTTAVEAAAVLDATAALDGRPLMAVRASSADARDRHRGVSHHTHTVLALCRPGVTIPVPSRADLADELAASPHTVEVVDVPEMDDVLGRRGLAVTTMGRGPADDPLFFAAAGAAGVAAAARAAR